MSNVPKIPRPDDSADVEVRADGLWHRGQLRETFYLGDGSWLASVRWGKQLDSTYVDSFSARDIRPLQIKRPAA